MGILNDRIKSMRIERGYTLAQIAELLNIKEATMQRYESGEIKNIKHETISKLANIFHCSPSYLMGWDNNVSPIPGGSKEKKKGVTIKILGRVAAGIPIEAIEDIIDTEEISQELAATGEFFGLRIAGDSMEPDIHKGDTVIVRQQNDAESGEIVIAMVNGCDATCKRLIKYAEGISLVSLNSKYNPMFYSNKDIEEKPVRIIGKVVESRRKW